MKLRGNEISMIFQEPMLSLNPVKSLYSQIDECLELSNEKLDVAAIFVIHCMLLDYLIQIKYSIVIHI